jgi:hypothetical protein
MMILDICVENMDSTQALSDHVYVYVVHTSSIKSAPGTPANETYASMFNERYNKVGEFVLS